MKPVDEPFVIGPTSDPPTQEEILRLIEGKSTPEFIEKYGQYNREIVDQQIFSADFLFTLGISLVLLGISLVFLIIIILWREKTKAKTISKQ